MIIAKVPPQMTSEYRESFRDKLASMFDGEKVIILDERIELIFIDRNKKRCLYCGRLNSETAGACSACGGSL